MPLSDEERIIAYVKEHGSINNAECRDLLRVDARRVNYVLQKMLAEGVLQRQGERRWVRYTLTS